MTAGSIRVQLSRRKGWRKPANTIVVARPSLWGNRFRVGAKVRSVHGRTVVPKNIAQCVRLHRQECEIHLRRYPGMFERLRGKNLACWCRLDAPCHADTLLELANR